ncbi:MAG TPA: DNA polymerase II large subunit [Thermoplasmata archaeon]|nr:DNA polymerase II large subunit [Thermoplasmata archaeon]
MTTYFETIDQAVDRAYTVARTARAVGVDPEDHPEIPPAQDMAARVEKLLSHLPLEGISDEIRALARELPRDEVAVEMVRRIVRDPHRGGSVEARLDAALRVGLAILTEGILVAPLEGLAEVHLRSYAGSSYIELFYAGPIRAAGGTAQAMSVLLADVARRELGLAAYRPLPGEVERYVEEIPLYKHSQHLQYVPSAEEVAIVVRNVPVCISGESTEGDLEVSAFRNLPRVPTNGLRGGACLVIAEGLCQKAPKLRKIVQRLELDGWEFLDQIGRHATSEEEGATQGPKYLAEAVGGRPVLAYPHRPGGFRLTYGRSRTTGLASCAVNPATMRVLRNFVAVGTQVKLEYPGKATAMTLCDTVEGPIVDLEDGTLTAIHDLDRAEHLLPRIRRIVDLGSLLVPFGEFLENNRPLVPGAYTLEWHLEELRAAGVALDERAYHPSFAEAVETARASGVPLHPRFLLFWHDLTSGEIRALSDFVEREGRWVSDALELPRDPEVREVLVRLGFLHAPRGEGILRGEEELSQALVAGLGLVPGQHGLVRVAPVEPVDIEPLTYVSRLAGVKITARSPSRIGARVGRPEKARQRKMSPNVHVLFPVGDAGGAQRSIPEAVRQSQGHGLPTQLGVRECGQCHRTTVWSRCACGGHTRATGQVTTQELSIATLWTQALERLDLRRVPPNVKGVKGLLSAGKVPEPIEKGILRASHGISVYQDGTARFDLTDLPLTHFRPREIGLSVEGAHALGYTVDWVGAPLTEVDQLAELQPQDLIVAHSCGTYLTHLAQFVDDELVRLYGLDPFYRATKAEDLRGHLVTALAPHTSGAVAGRLIGYTAAEGCFAHPVFHAAKRRNCDGDEDSVTLLLDALLNFSRSYLPTSRGGLMDKPLVLTTRLNATEVDSEAHNVDIAFRYPVEFYRAAARGGNAKEVQPWIETVSRRVGTDRALSGYGFTHDTTDIAGGPVRSAYREAPSMDRIVEQSLVVASQIRAVDVGEAVSLVLNAHFLPDLMGNLKSYATQKFRCKLCGTSYRRPPLSGRCPAKVRGGKPCDGALQPTVFEASVRKYLGLSQRLATTTGVPPYLRQRIQLLETSLATLFPGSLAQTTLESFQGAAATEEPLDEP